MTQFTGSILELNEKKAIVMTEACDFVSIQRQAEMFVGQQVTFQKSDITRTNKNYVRYFALIASVFIIALCSVFYFQISIPSTVFAYIDVDINPSMEFVIDKNAKVLDLNPLNNDAQTLLKNLKLIDLPIKEAIAEVVKVSKQYGFISTSKPNAVLISASTDRSKNYKNNSAEELILDNILTDISTVTYDVGNEFIKPEVLKVTQEVRKFAVKNDISMGRYALYSKIKEESIEITVEKAKTERVSDMLDKSKIKDYINNEADVIKLDKNKHEVKDAEDSRANKSEESSRSSTSTTSRSTSAATITSSVSSSTGTSSDDEINNTSSTMSKNHNTSIKDIKDKIIRHRYTNDATPDENNEDSNQKSEAANNSKFIGGNDNSGTYDTYDTYDTKNNYNYIPKNNEYDKKSDNESASEPNIHNNDD